MMQKTFNYLAQKLTRVTANGQYLPLVDGLRFLAIMPVLVQHMSERLTFPMLSLHSADNGLADVGTKDALARILAPSLGDGGTWRSEVFRANHGHQDALIGKKEVTAPVFKAISDFLS